MGKHRDRTVEKNRSKTLPSSPSHSFSSSSSSDFEFTIAISPRKSSPALCPADELFYKGQLLPLHLSPRISMVRTLLLSSNSSSSSSFSTATTARDSSSSTDSSASTSSFASDLALLAAGIDASCDDSARPSSSADDDDLLTKKLLTSTTNKSPKSASNKYFSLSRFSSIFKKDPKSAAPPPRDPDRSGSAPVRKPSSSAKEVIRKYMKKVKPLYEKLSQRQQQQQTTTNTTSFCSKPPSTPSVNRSETALATDQEITAVNCSNNLTHSFSGNLGCPRRTRRSCVASCPSSMRSSPSHSGVLSRTGFNGRAGGSSIATTSYSYSDCSTMEELQSAIQGAIAHCKNSMVQSNKAGISNEI